MITAIEIENFKGFGKRQRIEFAPITLLFGKNSAGKSSVFHALFFLEEFFRTKTPHFGKLEYFSSPELPVSLDGFQNTIHGQDSSREIFFRLELDVADEGEVGRVPRMNYDIDWDMGSGFWALEVGIGMINGEAKLTQFSVVRDRECVVNVRFESDSSRFVLTAFTGLLEMGFVEFPPTESENRIYECEAVSCESPLDSIRSFSRTFGEDDEIDPEVLEYIEFIVRGAFAYCKLCLHDMIYIGPLRAFPHEFSERDSWANGLAALEELGNIQVLERTNQVMEKISLGYQLRAEKIPGCYVEPWLVPQRADKTFENVRLRIQDVGCGVSQVLPLIVALSLKKRKLVMIEQPELHLHPSLQTQLGDLFLELTGNVESRAIIETHSEHLILRILRRIRETSEGDLQAGAISAFPDQVAVFFLDQSEYGTRVNRLRINEEGEFIDDWPHGFFEERAEELFGP